MKFSVVSTWFVALRVISSIGGSLGLVVSLSV